jgi:hypothetical protein
MARSPTQFSSAAERQRKLAEAKKKRGSESRGYDIGPAVKKAKEVGSDLDTRMRRGHGAILNVLGGAALTGSGLIGKALGTKQADSDLTRGRGAFKDVGKFAKAVVMGEPKGEKYEDNPGKFYFRGSDVDWEKKEKKKAKGGKIKKMAAGGSTASKRADGCATKGKTKGRFV